MKWEGDVKHEDWEKLGTRVHPYCRFLQHPSCQQATVLNDSVLPDPVHLIHKEGNVRNKKRKVKRHKRDQNARENITNSFKPGLR